MRTTRVREFHRISLLYNHLPPWHVARTLGSGKPKREAVVRHLIPIGTMAALLMVAPGHAQAQRVAAEVVIHSGPVHGRVVIGDHGHRHYVRHRAVRRFHHHRHGLRPLHVHHIHAPRGKARGWWKRHGYRPVVVFYRDGRFYDRHHYRRHYRHGKHVRRVVIWERGGRLYRPWPRDAYRRGDRARQRSIRVVDRGYDDDYYDDDYYDDDYDD